MKTLKPILFVFAFWLMAVFVNAQPGGELPVGISRAFKDGDAVRLSSHFNTKVELVLPARSGVFSKEQGQFLIKDFFDSHRPVSFQIIHQGVRENATFAIGRYHYNNGQFRIMILSKNSGGRELIHQIRVERQDE